MIGVQDVTTMYLHSFLILLINIQTVLKKKKKLEWQKIYITTGSPALLSKEWLC